MLIGGGAFAVAPSYLILLIGRLLFGVGGLIINLLLARLITASFAHRELSLAMGIFNSVYPASLIVIFSLHPLLEAALGWRGVLLAVAAVTIAAVPLHNAAVPRSIRASSQSTDAAAVGLRVNRSLGALAVAWMLFFGAYASIFTFAPEWTGGGPAGLLVTTLVMWTALVLNPLVGIAIDRFGRAGFWLVGGQLLLTVALAMMAVRALPPTVIMVAVGAAAAAVLTATYSLPGRLVPPARVGFAFGFITAFSNLSTLLGPAGTGALYDVFGDWAFPWAAVGATALAGAIAAARVRPRAPGSAGDQIESGDA
jgi:predicted MFS family arabinose efflux permease